MLMLKHAVTLRCGCRFALTGTPMQNGYKELWCLVNWSNMGHLGLDSGEFMKHYVKPLQQGQKSHASDAELELVSVLPHTSTDGRQRMPVHARTAKRSTGR